MSIIKTSILKKHKNKFKRSSNFEKDLFPIFVKKYNTCLIKLDGFDKFFPIIFSLGPWSGEILKNGRPNVIIANTIKGKGISFMEDDNNWHYRTPNLEELDLAIKELNNKSWWEIHLLEF